MEVIPKATYPDMSSPLISPFWISHILRVILKSPQETLQNCLQGKMGVSLQKFTSQAFVMKHGAGEHHLFLVIVTAPVTSLSQKTS